MSFDLILDEIGEFGVWQVLVCGILWVPPIVGGIHVLMYSFTGFIPEKFRCQIPECDLDNFTFTDYSPSDIFPRDEDGDYDYCFYKTPTINPVDGSCSFNNEDPFIPFISCPDGAKFAYGEFEFKDTLVTELNLVCGEGWKVAWVGSAYMFGLMVGSFLCGFLADKFGRKIALLIAIIISSSGSLVGAFMPEYYSYLFS
ncbi:solute carrier family 22 member 1, partial [Eurytemora carolleeae]|uniref:solute carrier family 22 member 1 n=1 Tax=Eurytemora carolleeae TaxID=1294199 RepID=UPI000C78B880